MIPWEESAVGDNAAEAQAQRRREFQRAMAEIDAECLARTQNAVRRAHQRYRLPVPSGHDLQLCVRSVMLTTLQSMVQIIDDGGEIEFPLGYFTRSCGRAAFEMVRAQPREPDSGPYEVLMDDVPASLGAGLDPRLGEVIWAADEAADIDRISRLAGLTGPETQSLRAMLGPDRRPAGDAQEQDSRRHAQTRLRRKLRTAAGWQPLDFALEEGYRKGVAGPAAAVDRAEAALVASLRRRAEPIKARLRVEQARAELAAAWQALGDRHQLTAVEVKAARRAAQRRLLALVERDE